MMLQSHIIDVNGVHVGAAIRLDRGYRFVAINYRLEELDSTVWPTLADVQRLARRLYLSGSLAEPANQLPAQFAPSTAWN
ncbi:MAG TPA: hypothetical protein VMB73_22815 [Acetobacteraceae bacterium]|jgi:hypothetical protein|nr:hypothetical protein [Acetobacteraceae bacterium]